MKDVAFLEPSELVDPSYFNAQRFWIAIYAGGENYYQNVNRPGDGDEALQAFLKGGGTLLVLPMGPFPFYYNEAEKVVVSAPKFGLPIGGSGYEGRPDTLVGEVNGWEKTPRDRKFTFALNPKQTVFTTLPKTFPFPLSTPESPADERWRPVADAVGAGNVYTPILTLRDAAGKYYGDGAALIEYRRGPLSPGRIIYVWSTLIARPDLQNKILGDLFRWVLTNAVAPPSQGMACFTHKPVTVDGKLDEPAWLSAQTFPLQKVILATGGRNLPTAAKVLWDAENLYVGFQCTDSDVWSTYTARDRHLWEEEVVEVFVDPDGDGHNYFEFEVNPLNTQVDLKLPAPTGGKLEDEIGWNSAGWKSAVTVDGTVASRADTDRGWTCEMAIPMKDLSPAGPPAVGSQWRVNLYRIDRPSKTEPKNDQLAQFSAWSAVQAGYHEPQQFGFLTFAADPADDDFSMYPEGGKPLAPWAIVGGSWILRDHHLVGTDSETNSWSAPGLRGGLAEWRDYRLTVDFDAESFGADWRDGPWFGVRCVGDSGYFVEFTSRSVQIHKVSSGLTTSDTVNLGEWPCSRPAGRHTVTIDVRGSDEATLAVALDGVQLGVARDKRTSSASHRSSRAASPSPRASGVPARATRPSATTASGWILCRVRAEGSRSSMGPLLSLVLLLRDLLLHDQLAHHPAMPRAAVHRAVERESPRPVRRELDDRLRAGGNTRVDAVRSQREADSRFTNPFGALYPSGSSSSAHFRLTVAWQHETSRGLFDRGCWPTV